MTFLKLVAYPISVGGIAQNGKINDEFSLDSDVALKDADNIKILTDTRQIKQIGGDVLLTKDNANAELDEVKTQLAEANAELDEVKTQLEKCGDIDSIIDDIQNMKQKDLREKYQKLEE